MRKDKIYAILKWSEWQHTVYEAIDDFFIAYLVYPNILEANNHTFSQFDFQVNINPTEKSKLLRVNENTNEYFPPHDNEEVKISSFETDKCSVDFASNERLKDREFMLIYDSEPDWGDDDLAGDLPVNHYEKVFVN